MKNLVAAVATGVVGLAAGLLISSSNAQTPAPVSTELPIVRNPVTPAAGSLQVQRINDKQFVVVKDMGDQQIVTLFSTEGGLVKKQHAGKFLY